MSIDQTISSILDHCQKMYGEVSKSELVKLACKYGYIDAHGNVTKRGALLTTVIQSTNP